MTDKKWFKLFDNTKHSFEWFFIDYGYESIWKGINIYRNQENRNRMLHYMNKVWFQLPDSKFNIIENPPGWDEFLALLS